MKGTRHVYAQCGSETQDKPGSRFFPAVFTTQIDRRHLCAQRIVSHQRAFPKPRVLVFLEHGVALSSAFPADWLLQIFQGIPYRKRFIHQLIERKPVIASRFRHHL